MSNRLRRRKEAESRGARIGAPHAASGDAPASRRIRFSFHDMVKGHCVADCTKNQKAALADHLWRRSSMTWVELVSLPHKKLGAEKIPRKAIKKPIPDQITADVSIWSFRVGDAKRMVGYHDGGVFNIVWLDLKLDVYDHGS